MPFKLTTISNQDGKCAGNLMDENHVNIVIAGMPGLDGDPTQSELEAHIVAQMKIAMERAIDNALS